MQIDTAIIDQIVAGVLDQLAAGAGGVSAGTQERDRVSGESPSPGRAEPEGTLIEAKVVTADVLSNAATGGQRILVSKQAIITPAARDLARERKVAIVHISSNQSPESSAGQPGESMGRSLRSTRKLERLLVVSRSTDAVERLSQEQQSVWRRELGGGPDEAVELATSAICRGDAGTVAVLTDQPHRVACHSNRNERIRAAAFRDASEVRRIMTQLKPNVCCIDPTGMSWFELRNLLRAVADQNTGEN